MRSVLTSLAALLAVAAFAGQPPTPPEQPKTGPGGSEYAHAEVVQNVYETGVERYWIFEPAKPAPKSAPVVVFNHGWIAIPPAVYLGWVRHIVRRGNIVIYPAWQDSVFTKPWTFVPNAIQAAKRGIERLKTPGHVAPELDKFAIVGHSAGGAISADMAALAVAEGLPKPRAVMVVEPGRGMQRARNALFPAADFSKIPADALLLAIVGEDDHTVDPSAAKDVFLNTPQIPLDRKDYIVVRTDRHGSPPLVADHISPCATYRSGLFAPSPPINALDYYGYWKLFDALTDYAFYGKNKEYCLGNTPQQRFMGAWSDGTPVKELVVTDKP